MNWIDLENELKKYVTGVDRQNITDEFNDLRNSLCDYLTQIEYNKINHESTAFKLFKIIANDVNNPYERTFIPENQLYNKITVQLSVNEKRE